MTQTLERSPLPVPEQLGEDAEHERIASFQYTLSEVRSVRPIGTQLALGGEDPIRDASRAFGYTDQKAGTHLYIHDSLSSLAQSMDDDTRIQFTPRISHGGKRSAHGVFFGDMTIGDTVVPVAVKPHVDDPRESCMTDYFTNVAAQAVGMQTLESVGMVIGPDGETYSLTRLEDGLTTLDSIDWNYIFAHEQDYPELIAVWSNVARQTAMLHSIGSISHNDLAPRNIAQRPDDGGVMFIDWERARISVAEPRDAEVRYSHSRSDVGELMESLIRRRNDPHKAGIGLLTDVEEPWNVFCALVLDEYVATRLDFAPRVHAADVNDELFELESSLKAQMDLLLKRQTQLDATLRT